MAVLSFSRDEDAAIVQLTLDGLSSYSIGRRLGRTRDAVNKRRRALGVNPKQLFDAQFSTAQKARMREMICGGASTADIAAEFGLLQTQARVARRFVRDAMRAEGMAAPQKPAPKRQAQPTPAHADRPRDADGYADGLYFKRGAHGRLFRWSGFDWRLSSRDPSDVRWQSTAS